MNYAIAQVEELRELVSDMYEALRMVREELCFGGDWETAKTKIDKALAKAEGKEAK